MDAGTLLKMLDLSDVLRGGRADIVLDLSSRGETWHQVMAGLAGSATWSQTGGAIDDDFARILLADLSGQRHAQPHLNCEQDRNGQSGKGDAEFQDTAGGSGDFHGCEGSRPAARGVNRKTFRIH